MSSSGAFSSPDHHLSPPSEHLRYVQCNFCDTVLEVSVPSSSLYATVTVRCGHCANLLSVNMRAHHPPAAAAVADPGMNVTRNTTFLQGYGEEMRNNPSNLLINQPIPEPFGPVRVDELLKPPVVNRRAKAEMGGGSLLKHSGQDLGNSSETSPKPEEANPSSAFVDNPKPEEADSSAASSNN